jgi:hypothetical protein
MINPKEMISGRLRQHFQAVRTAYTPTNVMKESDMGTCA